MGNSLGLQNQGERSKAYRLGQGEVARVIRSDRQDCLVNVIGLRDSCLGDALDKPVDDGTNTVGSEDTTSELEVIFGDAVVTHVSQLRELPRGGSTMLKAIMMTYVQRVTS